MAGLRLGPLLRYVDADSATVWVETDRPCEVRVRCGAAAGGTERTWQVAGHHYALVPVTGLAPGSETPYPRGPLAAVDRPQLHDLRRSERTQLAILSIRVVPGSGKPRPCATGAAHGRGRTGQCVGCTGGCCARSSASRLWYRGPATWAARAGDGAASSMR